MSWNFHDKQVMKNIDNSAAFLLLSKRREGLTGGRLLCAVVRQRTATLWVARICGQWPPLWTVSALCNLTWAFVWDPAPFSTFWFVLLWYYYLKLISVGEGQIITNVFWIFLDATVVTFWEMLWQPNSPAGNQNSSGLAHCLHLEGLAYAHSVMARYICRHPCLPFHSNVAPSLF